MVSEEAMREALEGKFTPYIGSPVQEENYIRRRETIRRRKEERLAKAEAARIERANRDYEQAQRVNVHKAEPDHRLITAAVAKVHGLTIQDLLSTSRVYKVKMARHHAMWEIRQRKLAFSLTRIGKLFGRDHSTVINSLDVVECTPDYFSPRKSEVDRLLTSTVK